ncbi:unnamed protein product, partial [Ostreobium quekettii]
MEASAKEFPLSRSLCDVQISDAVRPSPGGQCINVDAEGVALCTDGEELYRVDVQRLAREGA